MAFSAGPKPTADGVASPAPTPRTSHASPPQGPEPETIERWTERAADALQNGDTRQTDTLEATLDDPRLGRIRVKVRRSLDAVVVRVEVTDTALAGATEHRLEQLRRELRQGFDGPVSVEVFTGGGAGDDRRSSKPVQPPRDRHATPTAPTPPEASPPTPTRHGAARIVCDVV